MKRIPMAAAAAISAFALMSAQPGLGTIEFAPAHAQGGGGGAGGGGGGAGGGGGGAGGGGGGAGGGGGGAGGAGAGAGSGAGAAAGAAGVGAAASGNATAAAATDPGTTGLGKAEAVVGTTPADPQASESIAAAQEEEMSLGDLADNMAADVQAAVEAVFGGADESSAAESQ